MAHVTGPIFQSAPAATTLTKVYTCPASKSAVAPAIAVCNTGGAAEAFRIKIAIAGAGDALSQYRHYDEPLAANRTFVSHAIALQAGDEVWVRSTLGTVTFTCEGDVYDV